LGAYGKCNGGGVGLERKMVERSEDSERGKAAAVKTTLTYREKTFIAQRRVQQKSMTSDGKRKADVIDKEGGGAR